MSRNKVELKAEPVSVSVPKDIKIWLKQHPTFNLSKFIQMHLKEYIGLANQVETIEKETGMTTLDKIE